MIVNVTNAATEEAAREIAAGVAMDYYGVAPGCIVATVRGATAKVEAQDVVKYDTQVNTEVRHRCGTVDTHGLPGFAGAGRPVCQEPRSA